MTDARGFKFPKILRRQESKDNLRTVDLKSRDAQEISDIVSWSYLERNYKSPWEVKTLHLIENKELLDSYRIKKAEMKAEGRHARDLVDQYAFLLFRDSSVMAKVIKQGLVARQMPFNALGASKFGVYLCRNADVQLRLADGKGLSNCTLVVFKITLGKCKTLTQQSATEGENIEPTPNYDCHVSQVQARPTDSLYLQLARSQVFLYEYTDECVPAERPRQCLPYAILSYEKLEKRESTETSSAYGKQTTASAMPTATATASEIMASLKKSISFTDSIEKTETPTIGQRSSSNPDFNAKQQTEVPLQANVVQTESKPRDPRQLRAGDTKGRPADPRLNKTSSKDPRMKHSDPRARQSQSDQKSSIPLPNFSDPRFQPLDPGISEMSQNPSDPRLAPQDPRLNPSDPRIGPFAPSSRPSDPRIRANPTLKLLAKNIQSAMSIFGELGGETDPDDSAYRPSFGPPLGMPPQTGLSNIQTKQESLSSLPDIALPRDPRLRRAFLNQEMVQGRGTQIKSNSDSLVDQGGGKFQRKKLSLDDYKKKVEILIKHDESKNRQTERQYAGQIPSAPVPVGNMFPGQQVAPTYYGSFQTQGFVQPSSGVSEVFDKSKTVLEETDDDMPYSPDYDEIPDPLIIQSKPEDIIATPHMMMQTLSELSEPEDLSPSPQALEFDTSSVDGVESALTVAIRKLVEQSPDMSILTQAIQVLGQTHDMKDILEALKKAMESTMKPESEEMAEKVRTPEEVLSNEQVKNDNSPLSIAMRKTLAEANVDNKQVTESKINSEVIINDSNNVKPDSGLADIPLPENKPQNNGSIKKPQIVSTSKDKDPKIQEFVKFFLDKKEEQNEEKYDNIKTVKQTVGVKDSPGIGFSPGKSLLLGTLDRDERQHATKQLFQDGKKLLSDNATNVSDLSTLDRDERLHQIRNTSLSPILSHSELNVVEDVDERQRRSRNEIGDVDERSHSRSLSPARTVLTQSSAVRDVDERSLSPLIPILSKSAIPGLGDIDERKSHSRSQSPVVSKMVSAVKAAERNFPSPIMSPDPESSDSLRNEMLNKNNSKTVEKEKEIPLDVDLRQVKKENEFGDVDWRWTAAAEMGDVDLRAKPSQAHVADYNLPPVFEAVDDFWTKREHKDGDMEFRQAFGISKTDYHKVQPNKPYDSYTTSDTQIESYESSNKKMPCYSTTGSVYGEYSSSNKAEIGSMNVPPGPNHSSFQPGQVPSYFPPNQNFNPSTQPVPPQQPNMMNFSNILGSVNLDLANLKNILATVQKPEIVIPKNNFPVEVEEEEEVTSNLPAFVTGLCKESPKKDLTLTKYTGKPREWVPGKKPFIHKEEEKPDIKDPNYDPTRAPELQRPMPDPRFEKQWDENIEKPIKSDKNFEPLKSDKTFECVNVDPIKSERKFEPVKSERNIEPVKLDRNFKPLKSDRNLEPVKLDRNFEPLKSDRHLDLKKSDTKSEHTTSERKFEPFGSQTSAVHESKSVKDEDKPVIKKETGKQPPQTEHTGSEIRKLFLEDIAISRKTFKDSSDKSLNKETQKSSSDTSAAIFSVGDLVRQVRETSVVKDNKKENDSKESKHKKEASEKVSTKTEDKDTKENKRVKETADKRNEKAKGSENKPSKHREETKDKGNKDEEDSGSSDSDDQVEKIFSIGDMLKRMRGPAPKKTSAKEKKSDSKQKKKSSPIKSPRKRRSNEQDEQRSYQEAIMESLETSDLKVKHDDSVISEIDKESPKRRKHNDSISKDMYSDINQSINDKSIELNKSSNAVEKSWSTDFNKMDLDDVSDNSDDESFGLVIDLGETPAKKTVDKVQSDKTDENKAMASEEDEAEEQDEPDDCLLVEMEAEKEVVDLTEDDHDHEIVSTHATQILGKTHRQRRSAEDSEHIPLIKKIKTEKIEEDEQKERRMAEEAKLAEAFEAETDDSDMAVVAGQGDKVPGPQPRKKIVINLKSAARKTDKNTVDVSSEKGIKGDSKNVSETEKSIIDEKGNDRKKSDLGPIRPVERLGQRNLSEPRAPSPISVLGAPQRAPSPSSLTAHKLGHTPASLHNPLNTAPPSSQSWSTSGQQKTSQPIKQEQTEGQAIPNLSQISSIPPPCYRAASPVNQMVPGMSSVGPHGFSTVSPANTVSAGMFVARTMQNLPSMMPSNVSGITVPMPPVAHTFQPIVAPPNLSVPPPSLPLLNVPPPNLANQPPPQAMGQFGSSFPQTGGMPRMVASDLQTPPPNLRPTMQGNLTIPVIGQAPSQSHKDAMLQDVLQRVHQRVPTSLMSQSYTPPVQGMPIQTIGQSTTVIRPSHSNKHLSQIETRAPEVKKEKSKDDVLDWFSDKFEMKKEPWDHSTPIRTKEESDSRGSDTPDYHDSERKRVWEYHEHDDYGKKLKLKPGGDNHGDYYYESKPASDLRTDMLQQHPIENLNRGSNIQPLTTDISVESSTTGETMDDHDQEDSDLEEGECSEDSSVTGSPLITEPDNRRVVMQNKVGNNIQIMCASNSIQRIQTIGDTSSPKRIVKVSEHPATMVSTQRHRNLAAADWSDMLQTSHNSDPREKIASVFTRLESSDSRTVAQQKVTPTTAKSESSDGQDSAGVLASSFAVITKTKNKLTRAFQVKTLGDWLKVELDIENIQPLQKYIPYAFNTDLTAIPKGRRRKIKTKVRTVLEKEGKASDVHQEHSAEAASQIERSEEAPDLVASHVDTKDLKESGTKEPESKPEPPKPVHRGPPINPIYSPEVPNAQIQTELELIKKAKSNLKDTNRSTKIKSSNYSSLSVAVKNEMSASNIIPGSEAETQLLSALQTVETEMVTMLQRTYFYGYPHRRVPKDLLLESELYSFKSPEEGVFLILMMPLSIKPYNKLKLMKKEIEALLKRSQTDKSPEIEEEVRTIHFQREQVLKSFTGYLNKKRVVKLQDLVNKYTIVYDFFKGQPRSPSDSALKFIRTTQIDLRQHLILAKQYLAMEEKKLLEMDSNQS